MKIVLALPAYNEEEGLPKLLSSFQAAMEAGRYPYAVVVVDDGSHDGTLEVVRRWSEKMSIDLIRHAKNMGLGETIQDALYRATELAAADDVVVTMDADNTHSPELIPGMVAALAGGCDVVIASRFRRGSKVLGLNGFRRLMSLGARFMFQIAFPTPGLRDYTCGFRAYRASVLTRAFARFGRRLAEEPGFAAMAEILLRLRTMGLRFCEVPMVLRYDRKRGRSKMRVGSTVAKTLGMVRRLRSRAEPTAEH